MDEEKKITNCEQQKVKHLNNLNDEKFKKMQA
jgi:hypothetical protein